MLIKSLMAAALFTSTTVDVPAGTILCRSQASAEALVTALAENPASVSWLMAGACQRINVDFPDQRLIDSEPYQQIEWSNGIWRRERFVMPDDVAAQITAGRAAVTLGSAD